MYRGNHMKKINKKRVAFASLVIICLIIIIALIINLTILPLFNNSNGVTKNKQAKAKKESYDTVLWLLLVIILFMSVFFNMPALTVHMTLPLAINI